MQLYLLDFFSSFLTCDLLFYCLSLDKPLKVYNLKIQSVCLKASSRQEHDDASSICLLLTRIPCLVYELLGVPEVCD